MWIGVVPRMQIGWCCRYFEQAAGSAALEALVRGEYRGCEAAGRVGEWAAAHDARVAELFRYLEILGRNTRSAKDCAGFEVYVNEGEARAWLERFRPAIYAVDRQLNG